MNEHEERQIREALKRSFPPVNTKLGRDLWPEVLRKLDTRPATIPWYDWAFIALSVTTFLIVPRLVLVFAYYL